MSSYAQLHRYTHIDPNQEITQPHDREKRYAGVAAREIMWLFFSWIREKRRLTDENCLCKKVHRWTERWAPRRNIQHTSNSSNCLHCFSTEPLLFFDGATPIWDFIASQRQTRELSSTKIFPKLIIGCGDFVLLETNKKNETKKIEFKKKYAILLPINRFSRHSSSTHSRIHRPFFVGVNYYSSAHLFIFCLYSQIRYMVNDNNIHKLLSEWENKISRSVTYSKKTILIKLIPIIIFEQAATK